MNTTEYFYQVQKKKDKSGNCFPQKEKLPLICSKLNGAMTAHPVA